MFYLIQLDDCSPPEPTRATETVLEIYKTPGRTNSSKEERVEGWLGTTNNICRHALGAFETIEAARNRIVAVCEESGCRLLKDTDDAYRGLYWDESLVEAWGGNRLPPASAESSADWAYTGFEVDISAGTSDERIAELVAEYAAEFEISFESLLDVAAVAVAAEQYRDELAGERMKVDNA